MLLRIMPNDSYHKKLIRESTTDNGTHNLTELQWGCMEILHLISPFDGKFTLESNMEDDYESHKFIRTIIIIPGTHTVTCFWCSWDPFKQVPNPRTSQYEPLAYFDHNMWDLVFRFNHPRPM